MSALTRTSRPSSSSPAKMHFKPAKQELMTPIVSASRLRCVQELLGTSESDVDGILCILGIDGRYNEGSKDLANYLLFGFYEDEKPINNKLGLDEEAFDDLMILVKRHSVHVYCNPILYTYLIDYISHWRNLRLHCLQHDEAHIDEELIEEFKIHSFVLMVQGCCHIGIPYTSPNLGHAPAFDKMVIEKWPIVQAFALDEITGAGFFTMRYKVTDVGSEMERIYSRVDPVVMETFISKNLPLFTRQWTQFMDSLDIHISDGDLDSLVEKKVGEAFFTFFKHGHVSDSEQHPRQTVRQPFVLFGDHASRKNIEELQKGNNSSISFDHQADTQFPLSIMACQSVSPRGPLCCARTYSLTPLHLSTSKLSKDGASISEDVSHFQILYSAAIESVEEAMSVYSSTVSVRQTISTSLLKFGQLTDQIDEPSVQNHLKKSGNITLTIKAYDKDGNCQALEEGKRCPLMKTVTLTVYDVPSVENKGKSMGSIIFAESFFDSTIGIKKPDGSQWLSGEYSVLTADIPRLITWIPTATERKSACIGNEWGKAMSPAETVYLTALNSFSNTPLEGKISIWERSIVLSHQQLGTVTLTKPQISSLHLFDGDSPSAVAILSVVYNKSVVCHIPAPLQSDDNTLHIAFLPRTKAYKHLFADILPVWKRDENFLGVERIEELPEEFLHRYDQLERILKQTTTESKSPLEKSMILHANLKPFLEHLCVSSVSDHHVAEKDLPVLLQQPVDMGQLDNPEEILITIISGLPGSHKENLCQVLTNLAKEQNRWIIFKQPLDSANLFNPKALQQSLTSTLNVVRKKRVTNTARQPSLLILTPGYTDVIDVVKAITSHPDPNVKASYKIGAITCCVDPLTVYMEQRLTFPVFLNHCALGWVNNIVMTSCTAPQNAMLFEVQELIRSVNDDVAFILAENAQVTRSTDIDLILSHTAFNDNTMVRARHLLTPAWEDLSDYSVCGEPEINECILRFSKPLDRTKLTNKLKSIKGGNQSFPFTGNIYHVRGRTTFTSNVDKPFELRYVVTSEKLTMNALEVPQPGDKGHSLLSNFMVFSGCELKEDTLKDWLRSTTIQKPDKKMAISRKDLTPAMVKDIHTKNHLSELPEGWFYNGHQYVSLTGERTDQHPDMESFIEKYITTKNKEIELFNSRVDQDHFTDLFA